MKTFNKNKDFISYMLEMQQEENAEIYKKKLESRSWLKSLAEAKKNKDIKPTSTKDHKVIVAKLS